MMMKRAAKATYWLVALIWVWIAGYSTWLMGEKIHQLGGNTLHLVMVLTAGVISILPTPAIAARVARWVAGDSTAEQPQP